MTIVIISMCFVGNVFADEAYGLVSDSHMTSSQLAEIIEIDMSNTAVATEVNKIEQTQTVNYVTITDKEKLHMLHQYAQIYGVMHYGVESSVLSMDDGEYKYSYSSWKTLDPKSKIAGNQQAEWGYKYPTGGGFYYSESGGPKLDVSVAFGGAFGSGSITMNFGNRADSGKYVAVPDKIHYYKLKVKKQYKARSYIIYRRQDSNSPWQKWSGGVQKSLLAQSQWATYTHK